MNDSQVSQDLTFNGDVAIATGNIVSAIIGANAMVLDSVDSIGNLVTDVRSRLLGEVTAPEPVILTPAVPINKSIKSDHIVCLEDGKKFKMLKRHLRTDHDMTPDQYRAKWGLPADYPMTAPDYAEKRRVLALQIGLGRKPGQKRGRRKKAG